MEKQVDHTQKENEILVGGLSVEMSNVKSNTDPLKDSTEVQTEWCCFIRMILVTVLLHVRKLVWVKCYICIILIFIFLDLLYNNKDNIQCERSSIKMTKKNICLVLSLH